MDYLARVFKGHYLVKSVFLAIAYIITGKLGLMLAVPPGYATVIWPPSGIALGFLLLYGWRLWPGILCGSFLLNMHIAHELDWPHFITAFGIAIGSTLQALIGYIAVKRYIRLPVSFKSVKDIFVLFALIVPATCLVAATIGVNILYFNDAIVLGNVKDNWLAWWLGDVFGILVFLPLLLISPLNPTPLQWRNRTIGTVPVMAMFAIIIPLVLTFYAWKILSETAYQQQKQEFEALALENEKALEYRMNSYEHALLSGAGFFHGSNYVSPEEWHNYVSNMEIDKNFPGMKSMGLAVPVKSKDLGKFVEEMRNRVGSDFTIHPPLTDHGRPNDIVIYVDPLEGNKKAIGLNLGFEDNRIEAADRARDTGKPAITKKIVLVQSLEPDPGFLLLHPLYQKERPLNTIEQRRKAFKGWIYAPLVAKNILSDLTGSQGHTLNITIYDQGKEAKENLIYTSNTTKKQISSANFTVYKEINVMQQKWLVVWESTSAFDQLEKDDSAFYILWAGILFTGMFTIFVILLSLKSGDTMQLVAEEKKYALPTFIFIILSLVSLFLYKSLKDRELDLIYNKISHESREISQLIFMETENHLKALMRMAERWEANVGIPEKQWREDAKNYVEHLPGLKAIEWIDATNHVKWVEPIKGNESAIDLDVFYDETRRKYLLEPLKEGYMILTPPLNLVQGYKGFIAYVPVSVQGHHDGYIAGVFSSQELFYQALWDKDFDAYAITISSDGEKLFENKRSNKKLHDSGSVTRVIQMHGKEWEIRVTPTRELIQSQSTLLPAIILLCGFLIAALSALTMRYILVSRVKSQYLFNREEQLRSLVKNMPVAVAMFDPEMGYIMASDRWVEDYHPQGEDIIGKSFYEVFPEVFYTTRWVDIHHRVLQGAEIEAEEEIWTRADGTKDWMKWAVHPWKDSYGQIGGLIMFAEIITDRIRQQMALKISEETFRSAMENASIGMALVNLQGGWMKVNHALCNLVGYSEQELINNDFQSITHPNDLAKDLEYVRQLVNGDIPFYQMEKRYFHKNGSIVWALLSVSLVRDVDGMPKYFISQIQDITQQKEMDRIKSEFISVVSHELRTPLTSIRGSLGLMIGKMMSDLPEKAGRLIQIAYENSERLILLINDILDIDKIASGQMRFNIQEENVAKLVQKAVEINQAYAEKFNVHMNAHINETDKALFIRVDADRFLQILSNFLSNAAKFSPEGEDIDVFCSLNDNMVRISVRDHGPGIPEEFKSRIFGKFSQADSSMTRKKGGTGLGLNISKEITEHMGGAIGFDTETNKGSTFWIEFPQIGSFEYEKDTEKEETKKNVVLPNILHVEDDHGLVRFFMDALRDKAVVTPAYTLKQARDCIHNKQFSLIILDIGLPDGSGIDFLNYLQHEIKSDIPVIILTAVDASEELKKRVADYMVKSRMAEVKIVENILRILEE